MEEEDRRSRRKGNFEISTIHPIGNPAKQRGFLFATTGDQKRPSVSI